MSFRVLFSRAASAAPPAASLNWLASSRMPLKAKILDPRVASTAQMSSSANPQNIRELPDDEPNDVLFNSRYGLRTIELNRPKKLNALNGSMIRKIVPRMLEWGKSDMANVVVMKGADGAAAALCAGGDVAALAQSNMEGPEGQKRSTEYFALEYKLDHLIATYNKPYISFMDGVTMGGGVGLSIHAPFRIATERTVFAMPETTIGFFPDVGASFFLPRMSGAVGTYLALTSERLVGANAFYSGVATHFLHSTSLPALESRLAELRFRDYHTMEERLHLISNTIHEHSTGLPQDQPPLLVGELRKAIDRCFSKTNVREIIKALEAEEGSTKEWAQKTLGTLHKRSPTAVHVALRQMQVGKEWSITETFQREHQIAAKFMRHHDFVEGVSKQLIIKTKPRPTPEWQPATLEDVPQDGSISEPFFQLSDNLPRLQLLSDADFNEYPYEYLGVPTENDVYRLVAQGTRTKPEIFREIMKNRVSYTEGADVILKEILARKTGADVNGIAVWKNE